MPQAEPTIKVNIDFDELNEAIEKANKLVELLREAKQIVSSLNQKEICTDEFIPRLQESVLKVLSEQSWEWLLLIYTEEKGMYSFYYINKGVREWSF